MKKNTCVNGNAMLFHRWKIIQIMKLLHVFIFGFMIQSYAIVSQAQEKRLNLQFENNSLKEVLQTLEDKTDYSFIYKDEQIKIVDNISGNYKEKLLTEVLDDILQIGDLTYTLKGRAIVILPKDIETMTGQQTSSIKGIVTDSSGGALPGVTVVIKGTTTGIVTDVNGNFALTGIPNNAVLKFSFVGMKTQEVSIAGKTNITVVMIEDAISIDEVVAVGYGTQSRVNMTSAVGTVKATELNSRNAPNTTSLLQGRIPGLQIVQNSAMPGAENPSILIRGMGTFSSAGSNPLILIDGVEGDLNNVNPNNIAEISVLKDASSAAIYGSRAANGVILVTTKQGKEGRLNIDYNFNYSVQNPSVPVERVTNSIEYMELMNKAIDHSNLQTSWRYTDAQIALYRDGAISNPAQYPSTDWVKVLQRNGPIKQHFLSVNGGKAGTTFNVSLGILDQTGILLSTDYKRYDAQINFNTNLGSRVTFGTNIAMSKGRRHDTAFQADIDNMNASRDQMRSAYAAPPTASPTLPDGSGRFAAHAYTDKGGNKNPIGVALAGGGQQIDEDYVLASSFLKLDIAKGLSAEVKGAINYRGNLNKAMDVSFSMYDWFPNAETGEHLERPSSGMNQMWQENSRRNQYTLFGTLNYVRTFNSVHNLKAMVGYSQENAEYDQLTAYRKNMPVADQWEITLGPTDGQTNGSSSYKWALQSYFGRLNYDFSGKYLFEASFRYDGTSRLPKEGRWGVFPSVSAGWRISEENFMKEISWIHNLKIRGSWGQLGNQNIGNYPYQDALSTLDYDFGGSMFRGYTVNNMTNKNIKWETTTSLDFGTDFSFFNSIIYGSVDYYTKTTTDILRTQQVPNFVGISGPVINSGEMLNTGWEFVLGSEKRIGDFHYDIRANLETYQNELIKFGSREINGPNVRLEGLPWNTYFLLIQDGIYQNQAEIDAGPKTSYAGSTKVKPGDMKYQDLSGPDGVPDGQVDLTYDRAAVDGVFPKFNYGFNLSTSYKSFDFTMFLQGVHGRKTWVSGWGVSPFNQASAPPIFWRDDAWDGEGTSNTVPHVYIDGYSAAVANSTFFLGNSSYMRLKNIQLGYTLPVYLAKKMQVQTFRVFVSGDNLLTFTKFFQGLDPERTGSGNESAAIYPQAKIFTVGLKITL